MATREFLRRPGLIVWAALLSVALNACGGSRVTATVSSLSTGHPPLRRLAVTPGGGVFADAVGLQLAGRGHAVLTGREVAAILIQDSLALTEVLTTDGLKALRSRGVDAVLVIDSVIDPAGRVRRALVKLTSAHSGGVVAGFSWENAWGGVPGSAADQIMRKDMPAAATEVADVLTRQLATLNK